MLKAVFCLFGLISGGLGFRLTLIHTNDMHSRLEPITVGGGPCNSEGAKCYGGFARLKMEVDRIKKSEPNVLFLNAGDTFQGSLYYTIYKWKVIAAFIDDLGIDVMSLGNHEFDDGVAGLAPYLKQIKTPSVTCNINITSEPDLYNSNLYPYRIVTVDGVKIGVVGYLTPETKELASTEGVILYDEIPYIRRFARKAREEGAKIIIALGHSGYDVDQKIAHEVVEVDLVVGGHTNTFLYTGEPPDSDVPASTYPHIVKQASGKSVPVVQAFAYTKYLGHLVVEFDDVTYKITKATGNPILLDNTYPEDPSIVARLQEWRKSFEELKNTVTGHSKVNLDGDCRLKECNLGNFITDAAVHFFAQKDVEGGWTDAPIALLNGGSFRTSIPALTRNGVIKKEDIFNVWPFGNKFTRLDVNGTQLLMALERSVENYDVTGVLQRGNFLQFSGIQVVYDMEKPAGSRVVSAWVRCGHCSIPSYAPLSGFSNYSIITTDYVSRGGDGYYMLIPSKEIGLPKGVDEIQVFEYYISKFGSIFPGVERRIQFQQNLATSGSLRISWSFIAFVISLYLTTF